MCKSQGWASGFRHHHLQALLPLIPRPRSSPNPPWLFELQALGCACSHCLRLCQSLRRCGWSREAIPGLCSASIRLPFFVWSPEVCKTQASVIRAIQQEPVYSPQHQLKEALSKFGRKMQIAAQLLLEGFPSIHDVRGSPWVDRNRVNATARSTSLIELREDVKILYHECCSG